jgi:L-2-amino-thiazoline-4-carboxylic acid hydrolase
VGLRLLILSWWMPQFVVRKELSNVSSRTISALETLLAAYGVDDDTNVTGGKPTSKTSIEQQRAAMAATHTRLVEALEAAIGREQAVKLSRDVLFTVGRDLGEETRRRLGVDNGRRDLIRAAKILYRILGIRFEFEQIDSANLTITIDQCALAREYSKLTCDVLSATDEGVITGLRPSATMRFRRYMTEGCTTCEADIRFEETAK